MQYTSSKTPEELDAELEALLFDDEVPGADHLRSVPASPDCSGPESVLGSAGTRSPTAMRMSYDGLTGPELVSELERLCWRANVRKEPLTAAMNEAYRELGIRLNNSQLLAPRFRQHIVLPPRGQSVEQLEIGLTQKLIDLHWIHCQGFREEMDDAIFRQLLVGDEFDISAAEAFLRTRWKSSSRVAMLALTWLDQVALRSLLSDDVRASWKANEAEARKVHRKLRETATDNRKRLKPGEVNDFRDLWIAEDILRRGRKGETPPLQEIARVHGWQRGAAPLSVTTISDKRRRLARWLTP